MLEDLVFPCVILVPRECHRYIQLLEFRKSRSHGLKKNVIRFPFVFDHLGAGRKGSIKSEVPHKLKRCDTFKALGQDEQRQMTDQDYTPDVEFIRVKENFDALGIANARN